MEAKISEKSICEIFLFFRCFRAGRGTGEGSGALDWGEFTQNQVPIEFENF